MDLTLRRLLPQFVVSGLVDEPLLPAFRRLLVDAARLRDSRAGLAVIVAIVVVASVSG